MLHFMYKVLLNDQKERKNTLSKRQLQPHTIELGKLECVLDLFVLTFSVETVRFHNGGYRVAKRDLDIF